ncbi:hypothetical protein niasHT_010486 [Heterodera trifolii]|uniref:Uncharacterized protein n=1 Tax=Heterodera trifolii TaxID=157864 RepID=A0ABD2L1X7_9BILA
MCEAGTKFMGMFGNEPNEEAQQNAVEQFKKIAMMKKMGNCDELKQLLVQDPCEEAKLKVKKTIIAYERIFGLIKMIRSINDKSKGKENDGEVMKETKMPTM